MKSSLTYNEAFAKLETLVEELEDGHIQLDKLAAKVAQANQLIGICDAALHGIETSVANALKGLPAPLHENTDG